MASTPNTTRRKVSKKRAGLKKKSRPIRRPTTLGSPRTKLTRKAGISKRIKRPKRQDPRRALKYANLAILPPPTKPFEENCFIRTPIPENYVFVPKGDVYITRHCRSKTKETERTVYVVYDNEAKYPQGLRVPSDIYDAVLKSAAATAESRASAVKLRDEKDLAHSREVLSSEFPLMPTESLDAILDHAFCKGSGRVGRTSLVDEENKAAMAVEAHIRHTHTPYEELLRAGTSRDTARRNVREKIQSIMAAWQGGGKQPSTTELTLRSRKAK
ncbi:hypothetical protein P170DRAFT_288901 [Aspergillus steynii IBT 23096]|uniref:DUF2293 domain-containing protein n=1 Tax=Aspergillus steynii IBT 23096 TaxID=1392250 RepID=A0A2I2FVB5_9EURO|nr:uncharacterized protein P170DRAFT_288901 [Aspergillus steynii IBT 23096]PLB44588.1 hypothetical protein P170DRAFT_288901 [Aspergillus steynii IBT 23096]